MLTYTIGDLAKLSGVTPRTIRYYVEMGLLPPPEGAGRAAGYAGDHLQRLAAIKRLQADRLSLEEIREELAAMSPDEQRRISSPAPPAADSAAAYLARLREQTAGRPQTPHFDAQRPWAAPGQAMEPARFRSPYGKPAVRGESYVAEPWVRIPLAPDIELHVRGKLNDPRVSRLIREARRVLQEEGKPHEDFR